MTKIKKSLLLPVMAAVAFAGVGFTLGNANTVASAATECNHTYEGKDRTRKRTSILGSFDSEDLYP